jgi:hypothetical protein
MGAKRSDRNDNDQAVGIICDAQSHQQADRGFGHSQRKPTASPLHSGPAPAGGFLANFPRLRRD